MVKILADTGSNYNFISKVSLNKLNLKSHKNTKIVTFYTCLEEPFLVKRHCIIDFRYNNLNYKDKFYVSPRVGSEKIIIGRESLKKCVNLLKQSMNVK